MIESGVKESGMIESGVKESGMKEYEMIKSKKNGILLFLPD